jgi:hypothetical protein
MPELQTCVYEKCRERNRTTIILDEEDYVAVPKIGRYMHAKCYQRFEADKDEE